MPKTDAVYQFYKNVLSCRVLDYHW